MQDNENYFEFSGKIIAPDAGIGAYIEYPFDVENCFGNKGRIKVVCFFENIEYRGSLVRMRTKCHIIGVRKEILSKLNKQVGDVVNVKIKEDMEERVIVLNEELKQELNKRNLLEKFDKLSYTRKKELNQGIEKAKKTETKLKRIEEAIKEIGN